MDFSFLCDDSLSPGEHVCGCFGHDGIQTNLDLLLEAFKNTAILSFSALIVALLVGIVIGALKTLRQHPILQFIATCWTELFRNIPLLIQLFLWYFVAPRLWPPLMHLVSPYVLAILGLGFFTSARIAEQVRSGIECIPHGQRYAGRALGFSTWQIYKYILLPRALRTIIPPLISESMGIIKNSAAAFAVGIPELLRNARQATDTTSMPMENYFLATMLYILLALIVFLVMATIEKAVHIPGISSHEEK